MRKKALIFGATGQDGSYLCKYLIKKNYIVHGICRKKNYINLKKLNLIKKINLHIFSNSNKLKILKILRKNFDEIYFLSGQSSVKDSFKKENETYESQIKPLKIILNYIKMQKNKKSKFLYAGSSEMFGNVKGRIKEQSIKKPISPYGLSKLIGYEIIKSYRQMYKLPICTVILFNHESPLRTQKYVFKKIIEGVKKINSKKIKKLSFGNLKIKRDWGWAPEYMIGCNKILNSNKIDDYIIATGKTISLEKLVYLCFKKYNLNWKKYISIDKKKYRTHELSENYADITKIKKNINWKPNYKYKDIIEKLNSGEL
tara:strand:- start:149 stop:1090 length:942 start_codon:yes stop_codon:yes gene_type:complete